MGAICADCRTEVISVAVVDGRYICTPCAIKRGARPDRRQEDEEKWHRNALSEAIGREHRFVVEYLLSKAFRLEQARGRALEADVLRLAVRVLREYP